MIYGAYNQVDTNLCRSVVVLSLYKSPGHYSYRFGLDIPLGSMDDYLGVVWGPYISYDLWGSGSAYGNKVRIRDMDDYERLDVGWSLDLDIVVGNFMVFFS